MNAILAPTDEALFLADVLEGLSRSPKRLQSKYFYDARGSELFEEICQQPEYYLTRAELALMQAHSADMAAALGSGVCLIEYGSGSGIKTRLLLGALHETTTYVPIDISPSALAASVQDLKQRFPALKIRPVCGDFTGRLQLPRMLGQLRRRVVYFPGSTLGNFEADEAVELLHGMRRLAGRDGAALVGVDRVKDPAVLEAAYNDAAGVTAAFTLNLLTRINRELGADFDLAAFRHQARYNPVTERIETALVSQAAQRVQLAGRAFRFAAGESMPVEVSCKYTRESFGTLAARAGWVIDRSWSDPQDLFALHLLRARG